MHTDVTFGSHRDTAYTETSQSHGQRLSTLSLSRPLLCLSLPLHLSSCRHLIICSSVMPPYFPPADKTFLCNSSSQTDSICRRKPSPFTSSPARPPVLPPPTCCPRSVFPSSDPVCHWREILLHVNRVRGRSTLASLARNDTSQT